MTKQEAIEIIAKSRSTITMTIIVTQEVDEALDILMGIKEAEEEQ